MHQEKNFCRKRERDRDRDRERDRERDRKTERQTERQRKREREREREKEGQIMTSYMLYRDLLCNINVSRNVLVRKGEVLADKT